MIDVLDALLREMNDGPVIHCQVVETKGSTPQKAGARMLVFPDGRQVGTLGGGCVEAEVKQKAIRHLDDPTPRLHTFVLDHDYAWADGLICGGKMTILSEAAVQRRYFLSLQDWRRSGGYTEMIALDPVRTGLAVGDRIASQELGQGRSTIQDSDRFSWPDSIAPPEPLAARPRPSVRGGVAYLPDPRPITLVIVGAGHVGQAVADLAHKAGFRIVVADDRAQYANEERFPVAGQIVMDRFPVIWRTLQNMIDEYSYILVVTRGHGHDQEALANLVTTRAAYLGLIGSRRKIKMIFDALRESGISDERLARVTAPVGLDIGSETVDEIAVSIVAELIGLRNRGKVPESIVSGAEWR